MNLSEHFSLDELTASQHREFDNNPPAEMIPVLTFTAQGLERIRSLLDHPIVVSSGYRCPELNKAVGGQPNSQHQRGEAADWICPLFGTPREIALFLADKLGQLGIDQLILEFDRWVHSSFTSLPRHSLLTIDHEGTHQGVV